jgi:hypothetical protein
MRRTHHDSDGPDGETAFRTPPLVKGRNLRGGGVQYGPHTIDLGGQISTTQIYVSISTIAPRPKNLG